MVREASIALVPTPEPDILGEGPAWDARDAVLWWVDIVASKLRCLDPASQQVRSWILPEPAGSVTPAESGELLLAVRPGFARFDPLTGQFAMLVCPEPERTGNRFNDGKCDRQGRFVAGSMHENDLDRTGALYRFDPDGSAHRLIDGIGIPNSLAWSPDGATMFFAETLDRSIFVFDYDIPTGAVSNRRLFARVPAPGYPDGSTVDAEGFLWNAEFNGWRVVRYAPDGSVDRVVEMPVASPTCCAFGGAELDTLYVTSASRDVSVDELSQQPGAGGLFAVDVGVAGIPEKRFAGRF